MKHAAKALIRDDQGRILVLIRSETHPYLAHDIDLPGGEIEPGEEMHAGLEREIIEETGLKIGVSEEDEVHSWKSFFGATHSLYETFMPLSQVVEISWEHESYSWMNEEDLLLSEAKDEFMKSVQDWLRSARYQSGQDGIMVSAQ